MRQYGKYLIILLSAAFLFAGCSVNREYAAPSRGIGQEDYGIESGTGYIGLGRFCELYGLDCEIDAITKVAKIRGGRNEVRLLPDSNMLLINNSRKRFFPEPKLENGEVRIPRKLAGYLAKAVFKVKYRKPATGKRGPVIKRIVIDPGHGGKDPGAIGRLGLKEKNVVLDVSRRLKRELERRGDFEIVMTRATDTFVSLWKRSDIANKNKADLFVSIHANAARARDAQGFEVYFLSSATDDSARAMAAAENEALAFENGFTSDNPDYLNATVWDMQLSENRVESEELANFICDTSSRELCVRNRGVKSARFYVLKGTHMPAILVEVGFISNTQEAKNLSSTGYRQRIAEAIAEGIMAYRDKYSRTEGFTRRED